MNKLDLVLYNLNGSEFAFNLFDNLVWAKVFLFTC